MPNTTNLRRDVTHDRLLSLLSYDTATGLFTWIAGRHAGKIAGTKHNEGYMVIGIDGVRYLSHRLAWFYVTGEWPKGKLDHRDRNRGNSAFDNLREVTSAQNSLNSGKRARKHDLPRGVWRKYRRYLAVTTLREAGGRRKQITIGRFDSPEEAHQAWRSFMADRYGADFLPTQEVSA